jgi:4-amino-4-deoxy-L-arabinose transferase-like glycosyltransferase
MSSDPFLTNWLRPVRSINIVLFAGFICTIVGTALTSPDNSKINTGYSLRRAGNLLFLISDVGIFVIAILMAYFSKFRTQRFDPLLIQLFVVLTIMLVRIIYSTIQSWLSTPQNPGHNEWVWFGLLLLPDLLATTVFTVCGMLFLRPSQRSVLESYNRPPVAQVCDMGIAPETQVRKEEEYEMRENVNGNSAFERFKRARGGPVRRLLSVLLGR